jgi:16S rRNA processing protein RimM
MPRPAADEWVPLAVVGRPHGVRGEVRAHSFNKDSALLLELDEVLVRFVDGERAGEAHEVSIDVARPGNDAILLKLHGVDDRDAADGVRGAQLCARRGDFPPLAEGEFYACDVEGAEVVDPDGQTVGRVTSLATYPSVEVLVVETPKGRYEVPLVDAYVDTVDPSAGRVVLRTLEGLEHTPLR